MSILNEKTISRYEVIQKELTEKIQNGIFKPNERIPSEKEIVEQYGVSRITATKALTELSLNGYIYRIQGKGSFVNAPDKWIRPGRFFVSERDTRRTGVQRIGLIIPEFYDYHSGNIISGVVQTLEYPEYFVSVVLSRNDGLEENALNFFLSQGFSGIILFPSDCELYSDIILQMHLNKFPLVLIDRSFPGIACDSVICDNERGTASATEHLIKLGHTHIAFLADSTYKEQITCVRYNSYLHTMLEYGLPISSYENFSSGTPTYREMQHAFLEDVKSGRITAVIASNSHVALRLYDLCREHGISVPYDISILCFDNPNFYRQGKDDFFTYIDQDSFHMGQQAASILQEALLGNGTEESRQLVLEPSLVLNHSTCAPHITKEKGKVLLP